MGVILFAPPALLVALLPPPVILPLVWAGVLPLALVSVAIAPAFIVSAGVALVLSVTAVAVAVVSVVVVVSLVLPQDTTARLRAIEKMLSLIAFISIKLFGYAGLYRIARICNPILIYIFLSFV